MPEFLIRLDHRKFLSFQYTLCTSSLPVPGGSRLQIFELFTGSIDRKLQRVAFPDMERSTVGFDRNNDWCSCECIIDHTLCNEIIPVISAGMHAQLNTHDP